MHCTEQCILWTIPQYLAYQYMLVGEQCTLWTIPQWQYLAHQYMLVTVLYNTVYRMRVLVDTIILTSVSLPGSQRQFRDFQSVAMGPRDVRPNLQRNFHSNVTEKISYFSDDNWCSEANHLTIRVWPKTLPVDINIFVHHQKWREKKF